jgi:hypothetical protein
MIDRHNVRAAINARHGERNSGSLRKLSTIGHTPVHVALE